MQNSITFQSFTVTIMINRSFQSICIYPQVTKIPLKMNGFNELLYQIFQIHYTKYPKSVIPNILNMKITK